MAERRADTRVGLHYFGSPEEYDDALREVIAEVGDDRAAQMLHMMRIVAERVETEAEDGPCDGCGGEAENMMAIAELGLPNLVAISRTCDACEERLNEDDMADDDIIAAQDALAGVIERKVMARERERLAALGVFPPGTAALVRELMH